MYYFSFGIANGDLVATSIKSYGLTTCAIFSALMKGKITYVLWFQFILVILFDHIMMGECITILSAYTKYRHLG